MLGISDTRFAMQWRDNHTATIQILNNKGVVSKEIIMQTTDYFGAVLFLRQDNERAIYVETERITPDNYVHLEVRKYNPYTNNLLAVIELPNDYFTEVNKTIHVDGAGNIYHFLTTKDGVKITKWEEN